MPTLLLALYDCHLLGTVAFHVAPEATLISTAWPLRWLEALSALWKWRGAILPSATEAAARSAWRTVALAHHKSHESILIHWVVALCHHLLRH